jgi:hypothetical protein
MTDTSYNGWANYATWRVQLEIFDNISAGDFNGMDDEEPDAYQLAQDMQERAEYYIECSSEAGLARDYAMAFLSDVNWRELAEHMIEDYIAENQE